MNPRRVVAPLLLVTVLVGWPACVRAACGDNRIDGVEACDGTDVGGKTCADLTSGFAQGGVVACNPDCTVNADDCRRVFLESLIAANAGSRKNRCQLEWGVVGAEALPRRRTQRICGDGDRACDFDRSFNNACLFRIQLCMNVPDPRIASCEAAKIVRLDVLSPKLTKDAKSVSAILSAGMNAAPDQSRLSGSAVVMSPPVTDFSCGSATVTVALRGETGRARPGKVRLRARSSDNSGRVKATATLDLVCNP
jgi:hypothetical protein